MNAAPDKALFEQVAERIEIPAAYVEKDWHVTQVIRLIGSVNVPGIDIIFTGGTALAKAHGLLERFSEDVDFRIQASEEFATRKNLSIFRKTVVAALREGGFAFPDDQVRARDENRFFHIQLPYQTHFTKADALRPHIQVEVILRDTVLPPVRMSVASFVSRTAKTPVEVDGILCVDPVENAADKISALAWRIPDRDRARPYDDPHVIRHVHDLALLKDRALESTQFVELVRKSMKDDEDRPKKEGLAALSPQARLNLALKILSEDAIYAAEYDLFVKGVSYAQHVPSYADALDAVRVLARKVFS